MDKSREPVRQRRRNPQSGESAQFSPLKEALIYKLDNDLGQYRSHRLRQSKTWGSESSDNQEPSPALSLDKYVKAVLDDEYHSEKDPVGTSDVGQSSRNHTPDPGDLRQRRGSASPRTSRRKERSKSAFSNTNEKLKGAARARQGSDYSTHQEPWIFEIRGQKGSWKPIQAVLNKSATHSLINVDAVHRLGISLNPMPPSHSASMPSALSGTLEPRWWVDVQMRSSLGGMSPVRVCLASTTFLTGGSDMIVGQSLFEKLVGDMSLSSMSSSPGWAYYGLSTSASSIKDTAVPSLEDDYYQLSHEHFDYSHHQTENAGPSWAELYSPGLGLSNEFVDIGDEGREWLGGASEAC
ncbi:hypothetical protein ACHAPT_001025 [Fusarium lateritium]